MALPNNFAEGLMSFKQGIKDMKRIFNPTGPGLPEADAAMVADDRPRDAAVVCIQPSPIQHAALRSPLW